jgi:hypothetical protein
MNLPPAFWTLPGLTLSRPRAKLKSEKSFRISAGPPFPALAGQLFIPKDHDCFQAA